MNKPYMIEEERRGLMKIRQGKLQCSGRLNDEQIEEDKRMNKEDRGNVQ